MKVLGHVSLPIVADVKSPSKKSTPGTAAATVSTSEIRTATCSSSPLPAPGPSIELWRPYSLSQLPTVGLGCCLGHFGNLPPRRKPSSVVLADGLHCRARRRQTGRQPASGHGPLPYHHELLQAGKRLGQRPKSRVRSNQPAFHAAFPVAGVPDHGDRSGNVPARQSPRRRIRPFSSL